MANELDYPAAIEKETKHFVFFLTGKTFVSEAFKDFLLRTEPDYSKT